MLDRDTRGSIFAVLAVTLFAAGCSGSGDDPTDATDSSSGSVLGATLVATVPADVSGTVLVVDAPGFSDDSIEAEIEIDAAAFAALGIDDTDGLDDELVELFHGVGSERTITTLAIADDLRVGGVGSVVFEGRADGDDVPALLETDLVWVRINGPVALEGVLIRI